MTSSIAFDPKQTHVVGIFLPFNRCKIIDNNNNKTWLLIATFIVHCVSATVLSTFEVGTIINPSSKFSKQRQMVGHSQDQWEAWGPWVGFRGIQGIFRVCKWVLILVSTLSLWQSPTNSLTIELLTHISVPRGDISNIGPTCSRKHAQPLADLVPVVSIENSLLLDLLLSSFGISYSRRTNSPKRRWVN